MKSIFTAALLSGIAATGFAQTQINVEAANPLKGAAIQYTMYGLFFEDINYAADGGLYAEKIKNRSFEFPQSLMGWKTYGNVEIRTEGAPFDKNPHYVRVSDAGHQHKRSGLENEGYFGVSFEKDETYRFSVWARATQGNSSIRVELVDPASSGEVQSCGETNIEVKSSEWTKYTVEIKTGATVSKGILRIFLTGVNSIDLEHISLFPAKTWKGRENGLREDLAQKLADIHPGVLRFPGGCIVEGTDIDSRYQWKNSVGPVENRPLNENRWEYTFPHRFYPDYYQSYGLGFYEFFLLAEDIKAEPLPVLSCGLACQFQNDKPEAHVKVENLQPYINDALDLIEFANGSTDTKWGKLRAEMGHPASFNLKFIAVGNEQWDKIYPEHLEPFVKAIRAKYPDIKIIGTSGPDSEGKQFEYLWPEMKRLGADLVDEHFYRPESWFLSQGNRYDNYDRKGPKVFAGEYACHGKGKKWNHFEAALLEAAFMTNLERNADIVHMATYAPLFAHVEGWQWRPDMIWFDNLKSVKTCSYYVQQLYAMNKGSNVVKITAEGKPLAGNQDQKGLFASAVYDKTDASYIIKIANTSSTNQDIKVTFNGLKKQQLAKADITTLHSDNADADNTVDNQNVVIPQTTSENLSGNILAKTLDANTFYVFRIKLK